MEALKPFQPERILCPVDFSDLSNLALTYAASGAREFGAQLTVLHADRFEVPRYFSRRDDDWILSQLKKAKETVTDQLQKHTRAVLGPRLGGLALSYKVLDRDPLEAVLDTAKAPGFDLIIMGTHGYSGFKRLFLGSVAENVIRNAKIPVFTVRQKEHDFIDLDTGGTDIRLKRILCPCNNSGSALSALQAAASMARRFQAELTVLYSAEAGPSDQPDSRQIQHLEDFCARMDKSVQNGCDLIPMVRRGDPAEQIIAQARGKKDDLIILGATHRPFMESTVLGRTTELVLRLAPVPVMTVPHFPKG